MIPFLGLISFLACLTEPKETFPYICQFIIKDITKDTDGEMHRVRTGEWDAETPCPLPVTTFQKSQCQLISIQKDTCHFEDYRILGVGCQETGPKPEMYSTISHLYFYFRHQLSL
jgi:hypothetical protein